MEAHFCQEKKKTDQKLDLKKIKLHTVNQNYDISHNYESKKSKIISQNFYSLIKNS